VTGNMILALVAGSFAIVPTAAAYDPRLSRGPLAVLIALCRHTDKKTRTTFVSTRRLARDLGIGLRAVQQSLKLLEELGFIRKVPGRHRRTYEIVFWPVD
jgi:DNA-binding MarR family transcriptional regulator